jgi:heat shock protein HslJ
MKQTIFLSLLLFCFLMSCNSQRSINKTGTDSVAITGKEWTAIEVYSEKIEQLDTARHPNLKLAEGKMSGYSSCNRMHGTYVLEKEKISFGAVVATKMLCFDTQNLEKNYLNALSEVNFWEYKEKKLYFFNEKKQIIIVFEEKTSNGEL